jgi:hypothetical protein
MFRCVFSVIDKKVSLTVGANSKRALPITADPHGLEPLIADEVLCPVCYILNSKEPCTLAFDPRPERVLVANAYGLPHNVIIFEPIPPNPFVKMVCSDCAMHSATSRMRFSHEVIEILDKNGIEITRICQIEHA